MAASFQYLYGWFLNKPDYVPRIDVTIVGSALIAAGLMYPCPDKRLFHRLLSCRVANEHVSMTRFMLKAMFLLRFYRLETIEIPYVRCEWKARAEAELEGNDLSSAVWGLRGAFWLSIGLLPSGWILWAVLQYDPAAIVWIVIGGGVVFALVSIPTGLEYSKIGNRLRVLATFHWFDEVLSAVRRSEVTPEDEKEDSSSNKTPEARDSISQRVVQKTEGTQRKMRRTRNALYAEECEYERDLIVRGSGPCWIQGLKDCNGT